jgi:hypothetical protein
MSKKVIFKVRYLGKLSGAVAGAERNIFGSTTLILGIMSHVFKISRCLVCITTYKTFIHIWVKI